jgi:hypothetical protein
VFHLLRVEEPILSDRWTLFRGHALVGHGPMWADGHTMAAMDTKLIGILGGGRD